jgi:putative membrane protein
MPPIIRSPFAPFPGGHQFQVQVRAFGPGPVNSFFWLLVIVVAVAAAVLILSTLFSRRPRTGANEVATPALASGPLQILDERFARGEIDADDYRVRRALLSNRS